MRLFAKGRFTMRKKVVKNLETDFLEPSFKYLVKNGLENTSVRDLCRDMEMSTGSIYYWFENKDDIYINVVKYGISKVVGALFDMAFEKLATPDVFFDTFLDEVDKYKLEFRLIFQVTTSPVYGDRMREKSEDFKQEYEKYICRISGMLGCKPETVTPVIYMLISILVDYVVWDDREVSEMQLKDLHDTLKLKMEREQNN